MVGGILRGATVSTAEDLERVPSNCFYETNIYYIRAKIQNDLKEVEYLPG